MGFFTYRIIVSLAMVLMCLAGFGSALRVVQKPQPFTFSTKVLNVSCIVDEPAYMTKSIVSMQIMRHIGDKAIAVINVAQVLKMAVGTKDNVKAEGHIDMESNKSYLTLMIAKPEKQDAGTYRCQMFYMDVDFQMVEKNVIGNVTFQESDISRVMANLARELSILLTSVRKENNTLQTLKKQDITFKEVHSQQRLDIDILNDKMERQNNTIVDQNKQLAELRDYNSKQNITLQTLKKQDINFKDFHSQQKLDIDILNDKVDRQNKIIADQNKQLIQFREYNSKQNITLQTLKKQDISFKDFHSQQKLDNDILNDEVDRQNNTDMKLAKQIGNLTKQIDILTKDNTNKQQQLDTLIDYIKQLNETNQKHEKQLKNMVFLAQGWNYYEGDKTFNKAFGIHNSNERTYWSKARESCQAFGGDLVQIHDEAKSKFVGKFFEGSLWTWIGLRNHARIGFDFKHLDGSDLGSYHPWTAGHPDGNKDDSRKCVDMYLGTGDKARKWEDDPCTNHYAYVCSIIW